jgi:agmatine deiminase
MTGGDARHIPAEWAPHDGIWIGFPSRIAVWGRNLEGAQHEVAALVRGLATHGGERVYLAVGNQLAREHAQSLLADLAQVEIPPFDVGDVWLRDTGPIFRADGSAAAFAFNGWGEQFDHADDHHVARSMAGHAGAKLDDYPFVIEGGMLDFDGEGTALATRQCVLNPNRGRRWSESAAETVLRESLGVETLLWLDRGLEHDHTHGHVDNIARFAGAATVLVSIGTAGEDRDAALYDAIADTLTGAIDAQGRVIKVIRIASPGRVIGDDGVPLAASHLNFIIANRAVLVPVYGTPGQAVALQQIQSAFPDRAVIGLPANTLLTEGGSFHCISQQQPATRTNGRFSVTA